MYPTLVFIHILSGIAWIGTGFAYQRALASILKNEGPLEADRLVERLEKALKIVFFVAPVLVLATGLTMVIQNDGIEFSDVWIWVALTLFVMTSLLNGIFGQRAQKEMIAHREAGTQSSQEAALMFRRFVSIGSWDLLILMAIVAMMVYRPT